MHTLKRMTVMACLGALGAVAGALGGEALFEDAPAVRPEPRRLCLVFDMSGSMHEAMRDGRTQLEALRSAALGLVGSEDFRDEELALVTFASEARVVQEPTHETARVEGAIRGLDAGGMTNLEGGLQLARGVLAGSGERWILLFSDGKPTTRSRQDATREALAAASACREAGIHIAAVGTGLADRELLEALTGDPAGVFLSDPEALGEAFRRSGEFIQNREMLTSRAASTDLEASVQQASLWAALLALGTGLLLVFGQNRHLRRSAWVRLGQLVGVLVGSLLSGVAAGALGQGAFYALSGFLTGHESLLLAGRLLSWVLLGGGIALGMSYFVPNLPRRRATLGGALGGAAAALAFLRIVPELGDTAGRLLGAAILGLLAGLMIVLVEASVRKAWLVVRWKNGESTTLLLGARPILIGQSARAHICPTWDEPLPEEIGRVELDEGGILYVDVQNRRKRRLRGGERLDLGAAVVEVHEERATGGARPEPAGTERASEPRVSPRPEPDSPLPRAKPGRRPRPLRS